TACTREPSERLRRGGSGRDAGRVGRGPHDGEAAGGEWTAQQGVSGPDEQSLFERWRVGDDDVQVAVGGRPQDLPRRRDHGREGRGAGPERVETGERAGLLDRVGRSVSPGEVYAGTLDASRVHTQRPQPAPRRT